MRTTLRVLTVRRDARRHGGHRSDPDGGNYRRSRASRRRPARCGGARQDPTRAEQLAGAVPHLRRRGRRLGPHHVDGHPIDRTSQSITVNQATFWPMNAAGKAIIPAGMDFGNDFSSRSCRVNSPSSSQIACSVPNTGRVAFYSTAFNGVAQGGQLEVYKVSWRDDVGQPHIVQSGSPSSPDHLPIHFEW